MFTFPEILAKLGAMLISVALVGAVVIPYFTADPALPLLLSDLPTSPEGLSTLADGRYQLCSQPEPQDWRDGTGVCLNFTKAANHVEGYYGYPHSDRWVCIQGEVDGNLITGTALITSWPGEPWQQLPHSTWKWDAEGHLTLGQGAIIRTDKTPEGRIDWILFGGALLDVSGFYRYSKPRMRAADELCPWHKIE